MNRSFCALINVRKLEYYPGDYDSFSRLLLALQFSYRILLRNGFQNCMKEVVKRQKNISSTSGHVVKVNIGVHVEVYLQDWFLNHLSFLAMIGAEQHWVVFDSFVDFIAAWVVTKPNIYFRGLNQGYLVVQSGAVLEKRTAILTPSKLRTVCPSDHFLQFFSDF